MTAERVYWGIVWSLMGALYVLIGAVLVTGGSNATLVAILAATGWALVIFVASVSAMLKWWRK